MEIGRPPKETPLESIQYEIDFLRLALKQLFEGRIPENPDKSVLIELALLHYRNLIQFFTNDGKPPEKSDLLNVSKPQEWTSRKLSGAEQERLRQTEAIGKPLMDEYWQPISLYLEHLGKTRTTGRGWDLLKMYEQLEPALNIFDALFPRNSNRPRWGSTGTFVQGAYHTRAFESPVKVVKPEPMS